jgi:hypothetical protein
MKRNLLFGFLLLAAGTLLADPKEDVTTAAKALGEKDNYSWKSTTEFGGNSRASEGKIEKDGATWLSMAARDNTIEAILKGSKGAIKTEDGWQSLEDAANDQQGPGRFMARRLKNFKAPAAEAQDIVTKVKELKVDEGAVVGDLTEDGAKSLLAFGGRGGGNNPPEISGAKGNVKIWVKDGLVAKYVIHVQGTVTRNGNDQDVDRTTTVEIKDVGATKVKVPDEAKSKLS